MYNNKNDYDYDSSEKKSSSNSVYRFLAVPIIIISLVRLWGDAGPGFTIIFAIIMLVVFGVWIYKQNNA